MHPYKKRQLPGLCIWEKIPFNTISFLKFEMGPEHHLFCCWWVTVCVLQAVQWRPAPTLRKTTHQGERLSLILLLTVCPYMHRVCFRIFALINNKKKNNKDEANIWFPLQVPSRLKEALKTAKESLEKRLQEEQRVVRHYSHFTSFSVSSHWAAPLETFWEVMSLL